MHSDLTLLERLKLITLDKSDNFGVEFCGVRDEISSYLTKFSLISFQVCVQCSNKNRQNLVVPAVIF